MANPLPGNPHFGTRVREAREAKGMSKTDFAKRIGLGGHNAVIRIENEGSCSIARAVLIADVLGVSLDTLAGREPEAIRYAKAAGREELRAEVMVFMADANGAFDGTVFQASTRGLPSLFSVPELSDYVGVPEKTLYVWRNQGKGPKGFRVGRYVRYRREDVDAWLNEQVEGGGDK